MPKITGSEGMKAVPRDCFLQNKSGVYSLGLALSGFCNFRCLHCYYHRDSKKNRIMPLRFIRKLMNSLPQLKSVIIGLEGEPLLHPDFLLALDVIAKNANEINLVTNGSLLTEELSEALANFPINSLALSLEAGVPDAYENFRRGANWKIFIKNCENAVKYLDSKISFHITLFEQNLPYIDHIIKLAQNIGIKRASFQMLRFGDGIGARKIFPADDKSLCACLSKIFIENRGIQLVFPSNFAGLDCMGFLRDSSDKYHEVFVGETREFGCDIIYNYTSLLADGRLFPCCGDFDPVNIENYSFEGIFNNPFLCGLRKNIAMGTEPAQCAICKNMVPVPCVAEHSKLK